MDTPITTGLPASPGAACGAVYFTADDAAKAHKTGIKAVLVRQETSPEDIDGMADAYVRGGTFSYGKKLTLSIRPKPSRTCRQSCSTLL